MHLYYDIIYIYIYIYIDRYMHSEQIFKNIIFFFFNLAYYYIISIQLDNMTKVTII